MLPHIHVCAPVNACAGAFLCTHLCTCMARKEKVELTANSVHWPGSTTIRPKGIAPGPVNFALLCPMTGSWAGGTRVAGAAKIAVERINSDKTLLPGREMKFAWRDSGCSAEKGLAALGELLGGSIDAVIGPGCSSACEVTNHLAAAQQIPQISWGCTAPSLSNKEKHGLFSRTVASDTSKGLALIALMRHSKWKKIVILSSTEHLWFDTRLGLEKQLTAAGIEVLKQAAFVPGDIEDAMLGEVRRSGFRIVLVLSYDADTQTVASLAERDGMLAGFAWLITEEKIGGQNLAGWLWFRPFLASSMQAFAKQVSEYSKSHFNVTVSPDSVDLVYSAALYDAIMLYAHAVTRLMSEGGDLRDGKAVTAAVRNTSFAGVGGTVVALDSKGDRIESYEVMNFVMEEDGGMGSVAVGLYNLTEGQYQSYDRAVVWPGNTTAVPGDFLSGEYCRAPRFGRHAMKYGKL